MSDNVTREELEEIIGPKATDELLRAWGGAYYWFPKTLREDHPLQFVVGRYNADLLCIHLGGAAYELPVYGDRDIARRNELIIERVFNQERTQSEVAKDFGISERTVRAICHEYKERKTA